MSKLKNIDFYLVDDDHDTLDVLKELLETQQARVKTNSSSTKALPDIVESKPDFVILDLMMPGLDGLELCRSLRQEPELKNLKIVIFSGKTYEYDRQRAMALGADGYFTKPIIDPDEFIDHLVEIIEEKIELTYWGVRGTLPVPGDKSLHYGGNTICVTLQFPRSNLFILDAGSGIKQFSDYLLSKSPAGVHAKIFISHPHWDHINALPFFVPLYIAGNEFEILGPSHSDVTMRELISAQMDGVYFPIRIKEFAARTYFRDLKEQEFMIDKISIRTMLLTHPGNCLGYRMEYNGRVVCYVTDNELFPENSAHFNLDYWEKLVTFVKNADVLITDCTYTDEEYAKKIGWGHSSVTPVVNLATAAMVENLHLIHHDPDQDDDAIDQKLEKARNLLAEKGAKINCDAPRELQHFKL